jgi:hypothetical protein
MAVRARRFELTGDRPWLLPALVGIVMSTAIFGCNQGGGGASGPPVYPVTGVVKMKGQPVVGADIVFSLKDGSRSSFGRTDATGKYELTTRKSNDGALPGDYLVAISKTDDAAPTQPFVSQEDSKNYNPFAGKNPAPRPPPKSGIPAQYGDPKTSGLTARVTTDKNTIDFDLN